MPLKAAGFLLAVLGGVLTGVVYGLFEVLRICLAAEDATLGLAHEVFLTYGTVGVAAGVAGALTYWAIAVLAHKR